MLTCLFLPWCCMYCTCQHWFKFTDMWLVITHLNINPLMFVLQEEIAGKEEAQLRRLLNENEEVARQRDSLKKRLELMERAASEIMNFRT